MLICDLIKGTSNSFINIFVHITESFNKKISHQLLDYKRTFVNSQRENTNSKGDFVLKNRLETFV